MGAASRRPYLGVGVEGAVHNSTGVDAAQRAELADFLQQPPLPLLERGLPGGVVGDVGEGHLPPGHGYGSRMEDAEGVG